MKRFLIFGLALSLTLVFAVLQIGTANASTSDFKISDFQSDYYLDKDSDGRSTLKTIENITAIFPDFDQNHGIERLIPRSYDGHTVNLRIQSVKDQNGSDINYSTYFQNDNSVLRIGDADTYVHGLNKYVITYTQHDVTKYFSDTKDDEFYWDVNGTGWAQPFDKVTARLHVGPGIIGNLTGSRSCYYGSIGSTVKCEINKSDSVFTAEAVSLNPGGNVTIAVGFQPHTFSIYKQTPMDIFRIYAPFVSTIFSVIILVAICSLKLTKGKSAPSKNAIVAEYLPPKDADVALSAVISKNTSTWAAATYVDLAVRHKIRIIELEKKKWQNPDYNLEYISSQGLTETENAVMGALFGDTPQVGGQYKMAPKTPDIKLMKAMDKIYQNAQEQASNRGYYIINNKLTFTMVGLVVLGMVQAIILFALSGINIDVLIYIGLITVNLIVVFAGMTIAVLNKPLSPKGRELSDYLKGLKLYIKIGEQDRLKVLQSPSGAEKTPIDTNDKTMLVHLYERVLPYAVLFGQEEGWTKSLGEYYEQQNIQPDWYTGNTAFNAVVFSSALSSFSSSAADTSSYSSSSGGSGGGGFSGGGGGGGGGGGW